MTTEKMETKFYKASEVETLLGVSKSTLKRWIKSKKIKAVKFGPDVEGNPWNVSEEEVERIKRERSEPHYNTGEASDPAASSGKETP